MKLKTTLAIFIAFSFSVALTFIMRSNSISYNDNSEPSSDVKVSQLNGWSLEPQQTNGNEVKFSAESLVNGTSLPTLEQRFVYDQILANLKDADYIKNHTANELARMTKTLTVAQQHQLKSIVMAMINNGELNLDEFKQAPKPRHKTVAEGAPLPTIEEQAHYEHISVNLYEPAYKESLTFEKLGTDVRGLPPALRQELADKLNAMLASGELSAAQFYENQFGIKIDPAIAATIPLEFHLY